MLLKEGIFDDHFRRANSLKFLWNNICGSLKNWDLFLVLFIRDYDILRGSDWAPPIMMEAPDVRWCKYAWPKPYVEL